MQCSRCQGYTVQPTLKRVRLSRVQRARQHLNTWPPTTVDRQDVAHSDHSFFQASDFETGSFLDNYKSVLATCAVVGLLSLFALIFLSVGALKLGLLALPFLGTFLVGFVLSIGLPIKLRREYLFIKRG